MILRSYTYLRDAKAKGFTDVKLIGIITTKLQTLTKQLTALKSLENEGHKSKPTKEWSCTHCHSELHTGGSNDCPLKDFKNKVARRIAKEATSKLSEEPDVLKRLMEEEIKQK